MGANRPRGKRAFDLAIAVPSWVVSLPIQAVVALAVRTSLGKPVLFRQTRPGLNGEPFEVVKFRTLLEAEEDRGPGDDADRMTRLGRVLRATSLDELPTLWNVIRGDMSVVGPRPLLMSYLTRYTPEQARRHEVRPGVTGLAQVSGRNALTWEDKFKLDVQYVDGYTLWGDVRILAATVRSVIFREGISAEGAATAHEFRGTDEQEADE